MKNLTFSPGRGLALLAGALGLFTPAHPAAAQGTVHFNGFQAGSLVVSLEGSGASPLGADTPSLITLQQYTTSGSFVSSLALPTAAAGAGAGNHGIVTSGTSKSEGALNRSADGRYLTYFGYDGDQFKDTNSKNTSSRVVARIGAAGDINTTTELTDGSFGTDNPRSAVSADGSQFYLGGNGTASNAGVRYATLGAPTSTQIEGAQKNIRDVEIYNGQLYASVGVKQTGNGIFKVGIGLPTTGGQSFTQITGPKANGQFVDPVSFFFAGPGTLYVADDGVLTDGTVTSLGGLQKYTAGGNGAFSLDYTLQSGLGSSTGLRGLTGRVNGNGTVSLFGITAEVGEGDPTKLVSFTDTLASTSLAPSAFLQTLDTSPQNTVFRGVAFAPAAVPEASSAVPLGIGMLGLLAVFLRKRMSAAK